jgi:predicted MFS family arabinose efflux permease
MDRNSTLSIVTAAVISVVGVFGLMTQPMVVGIYADMLGFDLQQGSLVIRAEIAGGALASIMAMFWINRINWRLAVLFALVCIVAGNALSSVQSDATIITALRFAVGFFGQGTAFAIGISMIGNTADPDRNFGFVIAAQVGFGVLALATLRPLVDQFQSIGGMYAPLAVLALVALAFIKFVPTGPAPREEQHAAAGGASLALPLMGLLAMLIWCCGLGAIWTFVERIGVEGGLESALALRSLSVSSAVAITGALFAAALAARGVGRFLPVTIALLGQMAVAWFIQGEMSWVELAIKASIFQVFWNMTGPFLMGAIAAPDTGGKVAVLIPAAQTSGFFIGPTIAGSFMGGAGLSAANITAIACCGIALVVFIPLAARLKAAGH